MSKSVMPHPIHRVVSFDLKGAYRLRIGFEDGSTQEIDFEPLLRGELYGPLHDPKLFAQVQVDPEVHTLVWPNGADFDPATLHDWPKHEQAMIRMASQWTSTGVAES
jgi:hypothetical protein